MSRYRANEILNTLYNIRLSETFISSYKEIIDAQCFLFYISLLNYAYMDIVIEIEQNRSYLIQ